MVTRSFIGQKAGLCLLGITCLGLQAGCSKKESEETISLRGRVEKIERMTDTSGKITVKFFNEKQNKDVVGTAFYSADTKVEKNGTPATFLDLQEGIQVTGQVRSQREGGQKKYKAVLIKIEPSSP